MNINLCGMRTAAVLAGLALAAGCGNEASRLGYRGADVANDDDRMYFKLGSATNWVPTRVLFTMERYEMSEPELNLLRSSNLPEPGANLGSAPDGFAPRDVEPWFTTYVKRQDAFGKSGLGGFVAHPERDGSLTLGEVFFSTYHPTREAALAALGELQTELTAHFSPLKIHPFEDAFIAEYRRLRVMAVVGPRPDGSWSCMLNFLDKNRLGCGQWVPEAEQLERVEAERRAVSAS